MGAVPLYHWPGIHVWRLISEGEGIQWEDLDEDISVENLPYTGDL